MNIKTFTYVGLFIGSTFGWYIPTWLKISNPFFSQMVLSLIFSIIGIILAHKVYRHFN